MQSMCREHNVLSNTILIAETQL